MRKLFAAALALAAGSVFAQMKPGLWEITHKTQGAPGSQMEAQMAQARQQMANMPPEQRKMMEEMMAQRGMKMGPGGPGGMSMKMCMTKEMVERNEMPTQQRGDCKSTASPRVGGTTKISFVCSNPPSSGEGTYTMTSPEAYSMKMTVNTTMQGKPETINMEGSGKWLSADCGDVKPIRAPGK